MEIDYFKTHILPLREKLFRKALSVTESAEEARDVVQDVMMRLWDRRREWSGISNIEVYSMVMVKNAALDKVKRKGRGHKTIEEAGALHDLNARDLPNDRLEKQENMELVWKIIGSLPEHYGNIVKLREIEELSYREIAEHTEMSETQIKAILFKARQRMKEIYLKIKANDGY